MTMTFLRREAGDRVPKRNSRPLTGFWMQEIGYPLWKCPMQA